MTPATTPNSRIHIFFAKWKRGNKGEKTGETRVVGTRGGKTWNEVAEGIHCYAHGEPMGEPGAEARYGETKW